jgi:hypothetical protein
MVAPGNPQAGRRLINRLKSGNYRIEIIGRDPLS